MLPSQVCKHWRNVALSTPTLWTNIFLHVTDETLESQAALVTTWFSRSGGLPLSFTFEGRENVQPILAFLLQYCNRWQNINLRVPFETLRCLEAAKGHLQILKTMRIDAEHGDTFFSVGHIFELAPRLWKLSLNRRLVWNVLSGSWPQLVELDTGYASYTVSNCLALLQSVRNLQKLRIYVGDGVVEGHRRFVISHPLVSLCVLGTGPGAYGMLFDRITLPSLCDLSVEEMNSGWPQSQFISFLERSSPPIQSISLEVPMEVDEMWDDNMVKILQQMPSLHSLCLVYPWCEVDGDLFKRLLPQILDDGQVDCLIPKLNAISIQLGCRFVRPDY
jgi:hypothetical protein